MLQQILFWDEWVGGGGHILLDSMQLLWVIPAVQKTPIMTGFSYSPIASLFLRSYEL